MSVYRRERANCSPVPQGFLDRLVKRLVDGFLLAEQELPEVVVDSAPASCRNLCGSVGIGSLAVVGGVALIEKPVLFSVIRSPHTW